MATKIIRAILSTSFDPFVANKICAYTDDIFIANEKRKKYRKQLFREIERLRNLRYRYVNEYIPIYDDVVDARNKAIKHYNRLVVREKYNILQHIHVIKQMRHVYATQKIQNVIIDKSSVREQFSEWYDEAVDCIDLLYQKNQSNISIENITNHIMSKYDPRKVNRDRKQLVNKICIKNIVIRVCEDNDIIGK